MIKLKKKIRNRSGESIGETLVALLVAALALVMLAGAMTTALGVVERSREKLNQYYVSAENLVNRTSAESEPPERKINIKITDQEGNVSNVACHVLCYKNEKFANTPVVSYKYKPE